MIVGAAKAGTTTLYHCLRQHPQVFMPDLKEPHYFSTPLMQLPTRGPGDETFFSNQHPTMSWEDYAALFAPAHGAAAIGEASADYLYFDDSAERIRNKLGDVRIIVILRHPVDRAFSNYRHMLRFRREFLSFERALDEEDRRVELNYHYMWHYRRQGHYAASLQRFRDAFSRVHVIRFEDIQNRLALVLEQVFHFLEVDASFTPEVVQRNIGRVPVSAGLEDFMDRPAAWKTGLRRGLDFLLTRDRANDLLRWVRTRNARRLSIKAATRASLLAHYEPELVKLERLLGWSLDQWRR